MNVENLQILVHDAKCVAMKSHLGRASAEVVAVGEYVGLLYKSNDWPERKCAQFKTTIKV